MSKEELTDEDKVKHIARALEVIIELCESPVDGWSCKKISAEISRGTLERCGIDVKPNPWTNPAPKEGEQNGNS